MGCFPPAPSLPPSLALRLVLVLVLLRDRTRPTPSHAGAATVLGLRDENGLERPDEGEDESEVWIAGRVCAR